MTEATIVYGGAARTASLAKTLSDTGFERTKLLPEGWVCGASLSSPLLVSVRWLETTIQLAINDMAVLASVMQAVGFSPVGFVEVPGVADGISETKVHTSTSPMAEVADLPALHEALAAAFRASRGSGLLPPVKAFELATVKLPKSTEAERLIVQRVGQDLFRKALFKKWGGRCPLTGIDLPEFLRASHAKPWAHCDSDAERLDPDNGLLLSVHWDAAFDQGFVSFDDEGCVIWSRELQVGAAEILGLRRDARIPISGAMAGYLAWHREHVLRGGACGLPTPLA